MFHSFYRTAQLDAVESLPSEMESLVAKLVQDSSYDLSHLVSYVCQLIRPVYLNSLEDLDDETCM